MWATIVVVVISSILFLIFLQSKTFGKLPSGESLARILKSNNFRNGSFQNLSLTEALIKEATFLKILTQYCKKSKNVIPISTIPSIKTDLIGLKSESPTIIWFGHSSYLIKTSRFNILVDPVFSDFASPISMFGKAFTGSNVYQMEDMPTLDIVILTHDHYDHLDYQTILKLRNKSIRFYTSLGVGAHLAFWGIEKGNIVEFDWFEKQILGEDFELTALPARHFSGRKFKRAQSLWSSFYLKIDGFKIYLGGDSGYDSHFAEIGDQYGPFDIAILECGQYGLYWPYIHMLPEQTVQAAKDLRAKVLMPVHWAKFALAMHDWNEPINRAVKAMEFESFLMTTPKIGEPVVLNNSYPQEKWWNF